MGVKVVGKVSCSGSVEISGNVQIGGSISSSGKVLIRCYEKSIFSVGGKINSSGGCTVEGDLTVE
jgi:predicted acyltransferase (DUF342 family)